jgi:tyrosinase
MANGIRNRLGIHNLDDVQTRSLRDAYRQMMGISDNRGYAHLAGLHGLPGNYCWHHQQNARSGLQMRLFLPWHRAYLYNFEMAARDRVASVTVPWWDWTLRPPRRAPIPRIFANRMAGDAPNPLAGFRMNLPFARRPNCVNTARSPGTAGAANSSGC